MTQSLLTISSTGRTLMEVAAIWADCSTRLPPVLCLTCPRYNICLTIDWQAASITISFSFSKQVWETCLVPTSLKYQCNTHLTHPLKLTNQASYPQAPLISTIRLARDVDLITSIRVEAHHQTKTPTIANMSPLVEGTMEDLQAHLSAFKNEPRKWSRRFRILTVTLLCYITS